ncbi:MAG: adenosylcobalamin-dependent ribonucleoside-diphosphate reductase [Sulfobacillus thermosulfidooxidans]|uniref:Vitamin B12-dependent ribonucleotide reductase n=1 Tax=Sulfobacillus thermosulfidooxidans TaxID=28034 RepID=A0A2T2X5L7_SULTH|nr:MAG: adenosylcobalamin-dependent ribonucleoside-diphosphate reductase [Sulfobacillus thermosulfidooxidans]
MELSTGFSSELSWKIFLDRYTLKDPNRNFQVGDLAIALVEPHPKWPKKDVGIVREILPDGHLSIELLTGPQKGDLIERRVVDCDRPIEKTIDEVARRIARGVAKVEKPKVRQDVEDSFAKEIAALHFVPGGRIWAGAGTDQKLTYFNCYVIPSPRDSREGIVETLGQMIEIMSRGGGVGINISSLRPARAAVRGVNGRSSGAVSWMDLYSRATGLVEQGGSRRGALMLQIEDWHPDIWRFIDVKKTPGMVENANISVRISDSFMQAVKNDDDWDLVFPDTTDPDYDTLWDGNLENWKKADKPIIVYETVKARKIWNEIIKGAWQAAEPGIVFDERHEKDSNSWYFNPLISTNPCAEQPLPAWGVCTLGHINLSAFYDRETNDVNWDGLRTTIRMGVRFLDDIVDATPYFFQQNYDNQQKERRIGLGTMGLGELLIRLGLRYGSPESLDFIDKLYKFIAVESYLYDVELAKEKGPFPAFNAELYLQSGFIKRLPESVRQAIREHGVRNVTILTQAPTGTVGTMVGTSTGIEPYYALTYFRQSRLGYDEQYVPVAAEWKEAHPGMELPSYFVGAMDLTPEEHVYVQAAIQRWTDSSISKTANAPSTYTVEDTARLYELAYDLGCKGVTIYRDQSRTEQVLHLSEESSPKNDAVNATTPENMPPMADDVEVYPVPQLINGRTYRKETPAGTARVVINEVDGNPFEVFMLLGRAGSEVQSFMESLGRVISLYLRSNGNLTPRRRLELVAEQLKGIGGANQMGFGPGRVLSVVDAIGQLLESHLRQRPGEEAAAITSPSPNTRNTEERDNRHTSLHLDLCPQCDAPTLVYEEGCQHCQSCGYSKC